MTTPFPFDLPMATALYLSLYVVTLAIHVVFMSYSLGGACYLALGALFHGRPSAPGPSTARSVLVDWLPFSLGLTITAGVAPLLFVQIVYAKAFYTANLLLFYRWMMIVPVLIIGFYSLYLIKSKYARQRPWLWRGACVGAFLCFAFVAWSWTENHLLSADSSVWPQMYEGRHVMYSSPLLLPRLCMWFFGTLPVMAAMVAAQLRWTESRGDLVEEGEFKRLQRLALVGMVLGGVSAMAYSSVAESSVFARVTEPRVRGYGLLLALGVCCMLGGWLLCGKAARRTLALRLIGVGTVLSVLSSGAVRESLRVGQTDMAALAAKHAQALQSGGHFVFLIAFAGNALIIVYALRLAARAARATEEPGDVATETSE